MRKIFTVLSVAAVALAGAVSCDKASDAAPGAGPVTLKVNVIGSGGTRATGVVSNSPDTEAKVNTLQVLVFDGDVLDGYSRSSGSRTATVSCTAGSREIYAVVNGTDLSGVTTKSDLLGVVGDLANEISNFIMVGSVTETLERDGDVTIPVDRLAARVVIRGIRNGLGSPSLAGDFRIRSVYLTNVAGDCDLGLSSSRVPTKWYNRRGYEASNNLGDFTFDAVDTAVAAGATYGEAHFFYSMPNSAPGRVGLAGGDTGFTPRAARLVIRAEIAGKLYDYPILLPALEANHSYEINLVNITRAGNPDDGSHDPDDPDDTDEERPVEGVEQGFEITVNDWTVVLVDGSGDIEI